MATTPNAPLFSTTKEIDKVLYNIGTLNQAQRALVKSILLRYMSGGVAREEFKRKVVPELYRLVKAGKISSTDYENLKSLLL